MDRDKGPKRDEERLGKREEKKEIFKGKSSV